MGTLMKMIRVGLIVMAIFSLGACFHERELFLVANGIVPIYETSEDAMSSPPKGIIAELQAQQRVKVVKCIDVKHYLIYKVRLSDGRIGYVIEGEYVLLRNGEQSHC
ncbi:hypothetical protein [Litchfieldella rifensis]|uniref:SH3 domain-containing protein n=1 Tax=Litchfieldella rifensis TaxID=762643 RepID=A0ABV7LV32_9GAMM